ncbi:hypothetical protein ACFPAF_16605 [Hymenobacter endophyticus]|uniref:Uncharacterized protein n=1 Tax=Hymenobacter endophyticus TaxID=3076335 RepID=A0ABU3TKY4_9BACT|nr:hypothetical protein [Hymenobacter endophyticus]MDU0372026.1 hypothetical protein [Hymenobacter endophyticus]
MPPLSGYRTLFNTTCYFVQKADAPAGLSFASHLVLDQPLHAFASMRGWQLEAEPGRWLDVFNNGPLAAQLNLVTGELWTPTYPKEGWVLEGIMQPDYLVRKADGVPVAWSSLQPRWWGMFRSMKDQYQMYRQFSSLPTDSALRMRDLKLLTSKENRYGVYEHTATGLYYISYVLPTEFFQEYLAGPYSPQELLTTGDRIFLRRTGIDTVLDMLEKKSSRSSSPRKRAVEKVE